MLDTVSMTLPYLVLWDEDCPTPPHAIPVEDCPLDGMWILSYQSTVGGDGSAMSGTCVPEQDPMPGYAFQWEPCPALDGYLGYVSWCRAVNGWTTLWSPCPCIRRTDYWICTRRSGHPGDHRWEEPTIRSAMASSMMTCEMAVLVDG